MEFNLKWSALVAAVEYSGMENPDIWIEDLNKVGTSCVEGVPTESEQVADTYAIQASFATIIDVKKNRIVICHHY